MRKPLFNLMLLLACVIIFVAGLSVFLIITPGVSFFDIQYIRAANSAYTKEDYSDKTDECTEIIINSKYTPVNIVYIQSQTIKMTYAQNFVGFTRSNLKTPEMFVSYEDTKLAITINEFEKFGYGTDVGDFEGLTVEVPIYFDGNISITSNNSEVNFSGLYGVTSEVFVTTANKVNFLSDISLNNLTINNSKKSIVLGDNIEILGNLSITQKNGGLTCSNVIGNNLSYTTTTGTLTCSGCNGLMTVDSKYGKILPYGDAGVSVGGDASINCGGYVDIAHIGGNAIIETNSGDVSFGKADTTSIGGILSITTKSGDITVIGNVGDGQITLDTTCGNVDIYHSNNLLVKNKRGDIKITSAENVTVVGGSGNIQVNRIGIYGDLTTVRGNIDLSTLDGDGINNVKITTNNGKTTLYNPSGNSYEINSKKGKVYFYGNKDIVASLSIVSTGSDIVATNITGATTISTNGDVTANIEKINGKISVNSKNGDCTITLAEGLDVRYSLKSVKKNIVAAPGMTVKNNEYVNTTPETENKTIFVETRWGKITINR